MEDKVHLLAGKVEKLQRQNRAQAAHLSQVDRKLTGRVELLSQDVARERMTNSEAGAEMMGPSVRGGTRPVRK